MYNAIATANVIWGLCACVMFIIHPDDPYMFWNRA
jgi:hypothetical protein